MVSEPHSSTVKGTCYSMSVESREGKIHDVRRILEGFTEGTKFELDCKKTLVSYNLCIIHCIH